MRRPAALLIILALVAACYWQALFFFFLKWDEPAHFIDHPLIFSLSPENILNIFRTTVNEMYVPLAVLSHAIEYHFYSFNPMVYHFHNIFLHLGVTVLIFFFSRQCGLTQNASLIAALIFGVHPIHVESVVWITERKDLLYAFFYMASVCSYCSYLKCKTFNLYGLSLLCGLLSILAKPMALSLPLVLLLCDWIHRRKPNVRSLAEKIPFFLYSAAIASITFVSVKSRLQVENVWEGILTLGWTFSFYISKFVLPVRLIPIYATPKPVHLTNPPFFFSLLFIVILAGTLSLWRRQRWYVFALLLYVAQIFFLLRPNVNVNIHVVADRFMYLPSLGFCLLFGYLFDRFINAPGPLKLLWRRLLTKSVLIVYLSSLVIMTLFQVQIWRNDITLWSTVIDANPHNDLAYHNRGYALLQEKEYTLALLDFEKSLQINPGRFESYNNRGMIFTEQGEFRKALNEFDKALAISPGFSAVFINRGNLYRAAGRLSEAIKEYDRILHRENPEPLMRALAFAEKSYALYLQNDYPAAREHINQALAIFPDLYKAFKYQDLLDQVD